MTGPGGGNIFFVDYNDEYAGFNYLEAAPMGWGDGLGEGNAVGTATSDPRMPWCSDIETLVGTDGWAKTAAGTGAANTATADATCTSGAVQAAADYAGGNKTDWFLPSYSEMQLMYSNLQLTGVGQLGLVNYWTSSEWSGTAATLYHTPHPYNNGWFFDQPKETNNSMRPVRQF
jgi:hypothetical protein